MGSKKLKCVVCGRVFHEGQGVKVVAGGIELNFHSKSCALKFFKAMLLYIDQKELEKAVRTTLREFEERLKELEESRRKNIEKLA